MKRAALLMLVFGGVLGCDAERDLAPSNFACGYGGACLDGGSDGGVGEDASMPPPACDPAFGPHAEGGDPQGEWEYATACSPQYHALGFYFSTCPDLPTLSGGAIEKGQMFTVSGDLSIRSADLTDSGSVMWDELGFFPMACVTEATCAQHLAPPVMCMDAVDGVRGCICREVNGTSTAMPNGAWTKSGATLHVGGKSFPFTANEGQLVYVDDDETVYVLRRK